MDGVKGQGDWGDAFKAKVASLDAWDLDSLSPGAGH